MSLFQLGNFTLHSGKVSDFKIDCDFLTDSDLETLALIGSKMIPVKFKKVIGVPATRGDIDNGARFAKAMSPYVSSTGATLIVDDVLFSGGSMDTLRALQTGIIPSIGLVIFARHEPPPWITAIFKMTQGM